MGGPHVLGVVLGQMALFGDGVGDFLDSLCDLLADGAVGFANPVAGATQRGPNHTKHRHTIHLSGRRSRLEICRALLSRRLAAETESSGGDSAAADSAEAIAERIRNKKRSASRAASSAPCLTPRTSELSNPAAPRATRVRGKATPKATPKLPR